MLPFNIAKQLGKCLKTIDDKLSLNNRFVLQCAMGALHHASFFALEITL